VVEHDASSLPQGQPLAPVGDAQFQAGYSVKEWPENTRDVTEIDRRLASGVEVVSGRTGLHRGVEVVLGRSGLYRGVPVCIRARLQPRRNLANDLAALAAGLLRPASPRCVRTLTTWRRFVSGRSSYTGVPVCIRARLQRRRNFANNFGGFSRWPSPGRLSRRVRTP